MVKRLMLASGILVALLSVSSTTDALAEGDVISGVATAKDGDDVIVEGIDIRLQGIAAPEDNSANRGVGGPEATASLHAIVDGKQLRCAPDGTKARGRPVAVCFLDGKDVGELQVLAGHARDCARFSGGRYAAAEAKTRAAGHDLGAIYPLPRYCLD